MKVVRETVSGARDVYLGFQQLAESAKRTVEQHSDLQPNFLPQNPEPERMPGGVEGRDKWLKGQFISARKHS